MQVPVRVVQAVRPETPWTALLAVGAVGTVFVATPFLIPAMATHYGVSIATAGLVSTVHVAAFAVTTALSSRWFRADSRTIRVGLLLVALTAAASAIDLGFGAVLAWRVLMGAAEGTVTWAVWAQSASSPRRVSDLTTIIPASVVFAAPPLGLVLDLFGLGAVLVLLAVITGGAAILQPASSTAPSTAPSVPEAAPGPVAPSGRRRSSTTSLLVALAALTLGTSGTYVYTGAIGAGLGLPAGLVGGALAANALAGMVASRIPAGRLGAAGGFGLTIPFMLLTVLAPSAPGFLVGMVGWGFAYWLALPVAMRELAARSPRPEIELGRAHSTMAVGRIVGPVIGGAATALGGFVTAGVLSSAFVVATVVLLRREAPVSSPAPRPPAPAPVVEPERGRRDPLDTGEVPALVGV